MNDRDEFFIGYSPPIPFGIGRFVGRITTALVLGVLIGAGVIASGHVALEGGTFEFGHPQRFTGTIVERSYPALRVDGGDPGAPALLLVAPGKHGADAVTHGLNGRHASLSGTRIQRGSLAMIEIDPASVEVGERTAPEPGGTTDAQPGAVDSVTVKGEVVDSKCFLGVMVPGVGKTHKDCASLCLRGGIPPALFVHDRAGESALMLLTGPAGEAIGARALHIAGEAVEMSGSLQRQDGWLVLRTAPGSWRTVVP